MHVHGVQTANFPSSQEVQNTAISWQSHGWDCEDVVLVEFLECGATVNSVCYIQMPKKLRAYLYRFRPQKNVIIQHDNTQLYTSQETTHASWETTATLEKMQCQDTFASTTLQTRPGAM